MLLSHTEVTELMHSSKVNLLLTVTAWLPFLVSYLLVQSKKQDVKLNNYVELPQ